MSVLLDDLTIECMEGELLEKGAKKLDNDRFEGYLYLDTPNGREIYEPRKDSNTYWLRNVIPNENKS